MRVLLISPLAKIDPHCGDIIYTENLLAHPPADLTYTTYAEAIAEGALIEHGKRARLSLEPFLTLACKAVDILREQRILFWEPFRIFSVKPGLYDVIHVHVFSCAFRRCDCRVIVSNALSARHLYTDARGYSWLRVRLAELCERALGWILGVNVLSYSLPGVQRVIAFSKDMKDWYVDRKIVADADIDIVPIYLPSIEATPVSIRPMRIGFVAKDFDAKGGGVLLEAFREVRLTVTDAELVIIGSEPRLSKADQEALGIHWLPLVRREQLFEEFFPSFDVFAYPTRFDGMPLVLLEAMSRGIAIASTDYRGIPEMLDYGEAGLLSPVDDVAGLARNIIRLLEPDTNRKFRAAARQHFENTYSAHVVRSKLLDSYRAAITATVARG